MVTTYVGYDPPPDAIKAFQAASTLYLDTETTGLSPWKDRLALVQIFDKETGWTVLLRTTGVLPRWFQELFVPYRTFVGHNSAMFDLLFLAVAMGPKVYDARHYDTLIAESLLSTSGRRDVSMSLRASVRRRTGLEIDKDISHGGWANPELDAKQIEYACQDVWALADLFEAQMQKAADMGCQQALELEMRVGPVLSRTSFNGIPLMSGPLRQFMDEQRFRAKQAEGILHLHVGKINFNSPKQVMTGLAKCGVDVPGTAHDVLVDYVQGAEGTRRDVVQALLDYRAPSKRLSMYSQEWVNKYVHDGRVHPRFWSIGADTLRMSSSDPNLQQVPRDARKIFGNVPGKTMVSVDYSQLEIRIAAALSRDERMIDMLTHDDIHTAVAAQTFGCAPEEVTKEQRKAAKAASFTLLFGGSWHTLHNYARRNGSPISEEMARRVFVNFFEVFEGVARTRTRAQNLVRGRRALTITLPGGARRVLAGEKLIPTVVLNTTVQGTAACGLKHALDEAHRRGLTPYLSACVHDEIVATVPSNEAEEYGKELAEAMVVGMGNVVDNVPITTEIKMGDCWL